MPSFGAAISVGVVPGGGGEERDAVELMNPDAPSSTSFDISTECSCSSFILISFSSRSFCWRLWKGRRKRDNQKGSWELQSERVTHLDVFLGTLKQCQSCQFIRQGNMLSQHFQAISQLSTSVHKRERYEYNTSQEPKHNSPYKPHPPIFLQKIVSSSAGGGKSRIRDKNMC